MSDFEITATYVEPQPAVTTGTAVGRIEVGDWITPMAEHHENGFQKWGFGQHLVGASLSSADDGETFEYMPKRTSCDVTAATVYILPPDSEA